MKYWVETLQPPLTTAIWCPRWRFILRDCFFGSKYTEKLNFSVYFEPKTSLNRLIHLPSLSRSVIAVLLLFPILFFFKQFLRYHLQKQTGLHSKMDDESALLYRHLTHYKITSKSILDNLFVIHFAMYAMNLAFSLFF